MTPTEFLQLPDFIIKPILDKAYWLQNRGYYHGDPIEVAIQIYKAQNEQCRSDVPAKG